LLTKKSRYNKKYILLFLDGYLRDEKSTRTLYKKLIICTLIFIIPFIIEFVLDKMGFGANRCGIIDL